MDEPQPAAAIVRATVALGLVLLVGCTDTAGSDASSILPVAGTALAPAVDFQLTALDGETFTLDGLRGKPVVLNFWASWCAPCRTQMPSLQSAYERESGRGVVFLGAAVEDDAAAAQSFAVSFGIAYPIGLDDGSAIAKSYGLTGLPGAVFITREGKLLRRLSGIVPEDQLALLVDAIAR